MNDGLYSFGSNCDITISDKISISGREGAFHLLFQNELRHSDEKHIKCGYDSISLTTNGILYKADMFQKGKIEFMIETERIYNQLLSNDGCFAIMLEKFRPYLTVSCIGITDANEEIIAPAQIDYEKIDINKYKIIVTPSGKNCSNLIFEVNLYEQKLFQDTTVESLRPTKKNAFGGISFVGTTEYFGKQWMYIRPEMIRTIDILNKDTNSVKLFFPRLNKTPFELSAYKTTRRFCSLGSRWEKKVGADTYISDIFYNDNFAYLDITSLVLNSQNNQISMINGIVIKPKTSEQGFAALTTGDCYYAPPIIEINYNSKRKEK